MSNDFTQVAVPVPSLRESLRVLDRFHLAMIVGTGLGAVGVRAAPKPFYGCEMFLVAYSVGACTELLKRQVHGPWAERAQKLVTWGRWQGKREELKTGPGLPNGFTPVFVSYHHPSWFGDDALHARHRAYLLTSEHSSHYTEWNEQLSLMADLVPSLALPRHDLTARPLRYGTMDTSRDWV